MNHKSSLRQFSCSSKFQLIRVIFTDLTKKIFSEPKSPEPSAADNDAVSESFKDPDKARQEQLTNEVEVNVIELKEDTNNSESLMIPVFSEWTQQQMQEAEKKLVELTNSTEPNKDIKNETLAKHQIVKMRQKNYGSPDCGAKILASNPEAQSTSSVLSDKDEYLLSPCTDRIWFVVELCDSIQAQRVELANFELFSSPLKSVLISVSNRFPTREWTLAGNFDAKTERGVQVFDLNVSLFGKFVRVELTYYNSEHYCPLSFFRIYGTSEIEAFEVDNEASDNNNVMDDDDEFENLVQIPSKENLLNRAGAAVMNMVHKAAEALAKTNGNGTKDEPVHKLYRRDCISLSHNIICNQCSNNELLELDELVSCRNTALSSLLQSNNEIKRNLVNSVICHNVLGFDLKSEEYLTKKNFLVSILPRKYIAAMCNLLASDQKSLTLRVEDATGVHSNLISKKDEISLKNVSKKAVPVEEDPLCKQDFYATPEPPTETSEENNATVNTSVETTNDTVTPMDDQTDATVTGEELNIFNVVDQQTENSSSTESIDNGALESQEKQPETPRVENTLQEPPKAEEILLDPYEPPSTIPPESSEITESSKTVHVEAKILPPEVKVEQVETKTNGDVRYSNPPESVFLRLSNRIKTLEKNMTLSTQYLEELSRRYKKQIEELQQSFLKLQTSVEDQNNRKRDRDKQEHEDKDRLREVVLLINQKTEYMEVILIVVCVFFAFQTIFVFALFKRISILRKSFADHQLQLQLKDVANTQPPTQLSPTQLNGVSRTGRKRSKQRMRKISAPNILTQRSEVKNEFPNPPPALSRTVSAPNKFNASILTENKENGDMQDMLEENDDILIPGFESLKLNEDSSIRSDVDDVSTASAVSSNGKYEKFISNKSFKFKRRLSSPFQLKKSSLKKSSSDRTNETWMTIKASSESPQRLNYENPIEISKSKSFHVVSDDDGSGKFKKSNSFKKLFKKLF